MDKALLNQARRLNARNGGPNCPIPPIVLMTDDQRLPDPEPAIRALPHDSMVIFRHYGLEAADRARLGAKLRTICRARGIIFLVANDVALALKLDADGLHFPEYRIGKTPRIYGQVPCDMLLTSACHSAQTLSQLALLSPNQRPDGVLVSPAFSTESHPGRIALARAAFVKLSVQTRHLKMGAIALGGIKSNNVRLLHKAPICAIAGIGFGIIR